METSGDEREWIMLRRSGVIPKEGRGGGEVEEGGEEARGGEIG